MNCVAQMSLFSFHLFLVLTTHIIIIFLNNGVHIIGPKIGLIIEIHLFLFIFYFSVDKRTENCYIYLFLCVCTENCFYFTFNRTKSITD